MSEPLDPKVAETEINRALNDIAKARIDGLGQVINNKSMMRTMLQHEARRLERKRGKAHARTLTANARVEQSYAAINELNAELEISKINPVEKPASGALIHGRVTDVNQRGITGLTVAVQNNDGKPIDGVCDSVTNSSGYYALCFDAAVVKRLQKGDSNSVFVVVKTAPDKVVYREQCAHKVVEDSVKTLNIMLDRGTLRPIKPDKPDPDENGLVDFRVLGRVRDENDRPYVRVTVTAMDKGARHDVELGSSLTNKEGEFEIKFQFQAVPEKGVTGPDLYVVVMDSDRTLLSSEDEIRQNAADPIQKYEIVIKRGAIDGPDEPIVPITPGLLTGIGPANVEKLKAAGITDLRALIAADDDLLKKILGGINITELKREARKQLR